MHNALVISRTAGWAESSGLADALSWLSLATHEAASLEQTPAGATGYAVAIVRIAAGEPAPTARQWNQAGLYDAIRLTVGPGFVNPDGAHGHLREPITEGAVAAVLASTGYLLPLPGECSAIGQHLGNLVEGDAAITSELIASLLATIQSDLHDFQQACMARRWHDARAYAHRMKGSAHMMATPSLARLSQRIETLAQQGEDEAIDALAAIYVPALERVLAVLEALKG